MEAMGSSEVSDMIVELLLDIACQNKFMSFKGLHTNHIISHFSFS